MIRLVVALREEASPLISALGLRAWQPRGPYPVYAGEDAALVLSGVGKANAAGAVAWLHQALGAVPDCAWLNPGVAGHPDLAPGTLRVAHRITDAGSGRSWYPPQALLGGLDSADLISVDRPETEYPERALYDMEAAGFVTVAQRCATTELVHCAKIVSDNAAQPASRLDGTAIRALVEARLEGLAAIAERLRLEARALQARAAPHPDYLRLTAERRFSATERSRLRRLIGRYYALAPTRPLLDDDLLRRRRSGELLAAIEQRLRALPPRLTPAPPGG